MPPNGEADVAMSARVPTRRSCLLAARRARRRRASSSCSRATSCASSLGPRRVPARASPGSSLYYGLGLPRGRRALRLRGRRARARSSSRSCSLQRDADGRARARQSRHDRAAAVAGCGVLFAHARARRCGALAPSARRAARPRSVDVDARRALLGPHAARSSSCAGVLLLAALVAVVAHRDGR